MTQTSIAIVLVTLLVIGLSLLRTKTGGKYEVKTSDVALALVPVALWMLLTGKVRELTVGDVTIATAFREASQSPINNQVSPLPVDNVQTNPKEDVEQIDNLLHNGTQALSFQFGRGPYSGPAIADYLSRLSQSPSFRYVMFLTTDGKFAGMIDARRLTSFLTGPDQHISIQRAAQFANELNANDLAEIAKLPGLVSASAAVTQAADKQQVLTQMDGMDVQTLPVVDEAGRFVGVVDRSKLTASILLEIAKKVGR